ncbi:hypothetical protein [Planobispora longispora]|uniref:hypothetical protein n=1 Tax=Planobispora longispora TaxID=28887 RepID=UPI0035E9CEAC
MVAVAMGRGGELTEFAPDVPPLSLPDAAQLSAVDFMALQLPVSLVGYHTQSVDETLQRVANALSERDTRIAVLEQRVAELLAGRLQARQEALAGPAYGPVTRHQPVIPAGEPAELPDGGLIGTGEASTGTGPSAEDRAAGEAAGQAAERADERVLADERAPADERVPADEPTPATGYAPAAERAGEADDVDEKIRVTGREDVKEAR